MNPPGLNLSLRAYLRDLLSCQLTLPVDLLLLRIQFAPLSLWLFALDP